MKGSVVFSSHKYLDSQQMSDNAWAGIVTFMKTASSEAHVSFQGGVSRAGEQKEQEVREGSVERSVKQWSQHLTCAAFHAESRWHYNATNDLEQVVRGAWVEAEVLIEWH